MDDYVVVKNLKKVFSGGVQAVNDVSFRVRKGEFLTLLGPSGCGKTTTLRCIAGLEKPEEGEIEIDGEVYYSAGKKVNISPDRRNIGMVFQSYAVWPHMNVFDNVAYGLRMKKAEEKKVKEKVNWAIDLVGLQGLEERSVTKLSGGQQQRVAVARALAYNPKVLLFDEPLSNLDAKLRERMRLELIKLQREIGITSIYVTHDQAEAMVISDEIVVMHNGSVEQIGHAQDIYNQPKNRFVADFIGLANFLDGEVKQRETGGGRYGVVRVSDGINQYEAKSLMAEDIREGDSVLLFFRPENASLTKETAANETLNTFPGEITTLVYLGNYIDCRIQAGAREIRAQVAVGEDWKVHDRVFIRVNPQSCLSLRK
jgi:iron(III) transport system ATP-binding protein